MSGANPSRCAIAATLLALAACTDAPPPPTVAGGRSASTPAAAATTTASTTPTGPVTGFDGTYQGNATLNPDRSRRCPEGAPQLEATVRQGRASLVINPVTRQTLSGTVGQDGSVRMVDVVDRSIMTSGVFSANGFIGQHRAGVCSYAISLQKIS